MTFGDRIPASTPSTRDALAAVLELADPHYPAVMARVTYEKMADAVLAAFEVRPRNARQPFEFVLRLTEAPEESFERLAREFVLWANSQ